MASIQVRATLKFALVLCVFAAFWNGACGTTDVKPKASIQVNPGAVAFKDTIGSASPAPQSVAVSTDGQGAVTGLRADVSYGSGATGWLTATLSDTMAPATLTLTSNIANLTAASYQATVTLSANDVANAPLTLPVTFEVAPPPPMQIVVAPAALTVNDTVGTTSNPAQTVAITGEGVGTLGGLQAAITYGSGAAGWLTASLNSTTAPATLTLATRNTGLNASSYGATVTITSTNTGTAPKTLPITFNVAPIPPIQGGITIVALGNLGSCGGELGKESARVVNAMVPPPDYILMLGNSTMPQSGKVTTLQDYQNCYDPVWGQWKSKTYAVVGDKEVDIDSIPPDYGTGMASGADAYFGRDHVGPPGQNWYSFDVGGWHLIGLNVQSPGGYTRPLAIQFHAGSDELNWLANDLSNHSNKCTLAFWYQAMWYSASKIDPSWKAPLYKDGYRIQDIRGIWTELYNHNADVVVNGTPHVYERFDNMFYANGYQHPTDTEWATDSVRGIRQLTSGLGGDGPTVAAPAAVQLPSSKYRSGGNGVLKLVLGKGEYSWEFLNTKYSHVQDSGRGVCH